MLCNKPKFYRCNHCGNIFGVVQDGGVTPVCCGEDMELLVPNTQDGAGEKHVPVIEVEGNVVTVKIGEVPHPMVPEHHIVWVYLETENGGARKCLPVDGEPVATFCLEEGDEVLAAYEYCNIHGLWMAENK